MNKSSMTSKTLRLTVMPHADGLALPAYETAGSAGMDLRAAFEAETALIIAPGERELVPTGLKIAIPQGMEGQVRPRSGLALKKGLTVLNSPGTIDSDYRGEIKVLLINHGQEPVMIAHGDRIAQLVFAHVIQLVPVKVSSLDTTSRGSGGYGSTGIA